MSLRQPNGNERKSVPHFVWFIIDPARHLTAFHRSPHHTLFDGAIRIRSYQGFVLAPGHQSNFPQLSSSIIMDSLPPMPIPNGHESTSRHDGPIFLPDHITPTNLNNISTINRSRLQRQSLSSVPTEQSKPSRDNCNRRRPEDAEDSSRLPNMSQQLMGQSVTPFLREHIPGLYAPIGKPDLPSMAAITTKDPNSKYCYRHRPDSKCRRAADETKMGLIQSVCSCPPPCVT